MRRLEIIHLRLVDGRAESLIAEIQRAIAAASVTGVRIYRGETLTSDLAIHLTSEPHDSGTEPSTLALRLADALREHGMVEHAVWIAVVGEGDGVPQENES